MKMRFLTVVAAVALLAACSSNEEAGKANTGAGTAAATTAAAKPGVVPGSQADFVANVGDRVFFAFDKSDLSAQARQQLASWVVFLKKYPQDKMTVEGHCDDRGTREYNLALGARRANAVKEFLVAQGVPAASLKTISYGKERPAVLGDNETAWAQNRRGVGVIGE